VKAILEEAGGDSPVAFLGDDITDEMAFQVVNTLGPRGLTALVRREWRSTDGMIWLRPPGDLMVFLNKWLDAANRLV
jgi:trehalose-6-phosphatase